MLEWLSGLNVELVAGGLVGFSLLGVVIRNAITGWAEARTKLRAAEKSMAPMTSAMSLSWDRDQIERALQALETMAESMKKSASHSEAIARAQGILSDSFQHTTQTKLDDLLEKLEHVQHPYQPTRKR